MLAPRKKFHSHVYYVIGSICSFLIVWHVFMQVVAAGANPIQITRGMERTAKALVEELKLMSKDVSGNFQYVIPLTVPDMVCCLLLLTLQMCLSYLLNQHQLFHYLLY